MAQEIKLSGGEITILKAIGLSGIAVRGKQLLERVGEMEEAELLDDLKGLISLGYVLSDKVNLFNSADIERASLRVDTSHSRDLRNALHPGQNRDKERRRRRG